MKTKQIMSKLTTLILILPIIVLLSSCGDDTMNEMEMEKNDCVEYTPSPASNTIMGNWSEANEKDRYIDEIVIPNDLGGGYVKVVLSQSDENLKPWLTIDNDFDAGGAIVSGSSEATNNERNRTVYFSAHPGKKYSIEVFPFFNADIEDYPVDYSITWEFISRVDCFEANDVQADAKKLLLNETIEAYAIAGHIDDGVGALDDQTYDWYKVSVDEAQKLEAEILTMPSDMRIKMRFFKEDETTVPIDFEWLTSETPNNNGRLSKITSSQVLDPGTYYIELHSDFVQSRVAKNDTEEIPEHFNKKYSLKVSSL